MTTLLWLWVLSVPLKRALALALIAAVEVGQRGADGCPFALVGKIRSPTFCDESNFTGQELAKHIMNFYGFLASLRLLNDFVEGNLESFLVKIMTKIFAMLQVVGAIAETMTPGCNQQ